MRDEIIHLLGSKTNIVKMLKKDGELQEVFFVKDIGLVDLASIQLLDGVKSVSVVRGKITIHYQKWRGNRMSKDFNKLGNQILELIGGKSNVEYFTHCITRLRFELKNKNLVKLEEIRSLKGVIGVQWSGEQFQIIIGNDVSDVYNKVCEIANFDKVERIDESLKSPKKKEWSFNTLFEVISGCMVPILPALCAAGVTKGIIVMCTNYLGMDTESSLYVLLNTIGDVAFYFMPFLVANSAANKFHTNQILALCVAGIYLYPSIIALAGKELEIFGLNIHILNYSSTVFPTIISVWVLSHVYKMIDSHCPNSLKFVISPSLSLLIMTPICLGIIGPIGYYIGYYLASGVSSLFYLNPYLGGLVLGLIRPFVLLTGMQTTFTPIIINNLTTLGYDFIWPVHSVFSMCCCGLVFGAFLRAKNSKDERINSEKENFFTSFISGFVGVAEPALYGNAFRFKSQLYALLISSGICGALTGGLGGKAVAAGNPPWLFLPTFGDTAGLMAVMFVLSFILTAISAYIFGFSNFSFLKKGK